MIDDEAERRSMMSMVNKVNIVDRICSFLSNIPIAPRIACVQKSHRDGARERERIVCILTLDDHSLQFIQNIILLHAPKRMDIHEYLAASLIHHVALESVSSRT